MAEEAGIEKITTKIITDAQLKADEIIRDAEKEAEERRKKARERGERIKAEIIEEAKKSVETEKRRRIADAMIKARTLKLEIMEREINRAFSEAEKKLQSMDEKEYEKVLERIIVDSIAELGEENIVVLLREEDMKKIDEKSIKSRVEKELGKKIKIKFEKGDFNSGGAIVRAESAGITINSTFAARLEFLKEKLRVEVAKMLFG